MYEVVLARLAEIDVDQKRDLGEREERNAQRQDDFAERQARAGDVIDARQKKFAYL